MSHERSFLHIHFKSMKVVYFVPLIASALAVRSFRRETHNSAASPGSVAPRIIPQNLDGVSSPDTYSGIRVRRIHAYSYIHPYFSTTRRAVPSTSMLVVRPCNTM
jgi:hypothetical protein